MTRRLTGEAMSTGSVWNRRSPPIAWPIPNMAATAAAQNTFPIRKNESDSTPAERPR